MMELQPFITEQDFAFEGIPVLTVSVSVPQPTATQDRISRRIFRYYRQQAGSYLKYCQRTLFPLAAAEYQAALSVSTPFSPFRGELRYEITWQDSHFLSLYTQSKEICGTRFLLQRWGDTWDLTCGVPVPLSDFFPVHSHWKQQLLRRISEEIRSREETGLSQYHIHNWRALRRVWNPQNYYLSPSGLSLFFPMYSIAAASEGIPTFSFPLPGKNTSSADPCKT
jgi:hypothetical protein